MKPEKNLNWLPLIIIGASVLIFLRIGYKANRYWHSVGIELVTYGHARCNQVNEVIITRYLIPMLVIIVLAIAGVALSVAYG